MIDVLPPARRVADDPLVTGNGVRVCLADQIGELRLDPIRDEAGRLPSAHRARLNAQSARDGGLPADRAAEKRDGGIPEFVGLHPAWPPIAPGKTVNPRYSARR